MFDYLFIVREGRPCQTDIECGSGNIRVCRNGRCRNPNIGDRCIPKDMMYIQKTTCDAGLCDPDLEQCRCMLKCYLTVYTN